MTMSSLISTAVAAIDVVTITDATTTTTSTTAVFQLWAFLCGFP